jgi:hypothetical protein
MDRNLKLGLLITGITVLLAGCVPTSELRTNDPGTGTESGITPAPQQEEMIPARLECDAPTERAIQTTIGDQIDAFTQGDFEAAYDLAAPSFRQRVSPSYFEEIIRADYSLLLEASGFSMSACLTNSTITTAEALITIRPLTGETSQLVYDLENTAKGWKIAGAMVANTPRTAT